MKSKVSTEGVCYLCGESLTGEIDLDHVPPRQLYAKNIRKMHNPNLFTLPTHKGCNKAYQNDEDYFVHSIAPLAMESYSGGQIWKDILRRKQRPQGNLLHEKVYKEFDPTPSGLVLPDGKVIKRFDGKRVWRVVWKITKGLFFKEKNQFLPDDLPHNYKIYSAGERPDPEFENLRNTPSRGQYPGVFDYKYVDVPNLNDFHVWAFLFWDKLIFQVAFHDPKCPCEKCQKCEQVV